MGRLLVLSWVFLCACGGVVTEGSDGGSAGKDGGVSDATIGFDVSVLDVTVVDVASDGPLPVGPCPSSPPANGDACSSSGLVCEYGSSWDPQCNAVFTCNGDGTWHEQLPGVCPTSTGCPTTIPTSGTMCPAMNEECDYLTGTCFCVLGCGGPPPPPDLPHHWSCDVMKAGCPWPRPDIGNTCATEGQECDYVTCCAGIILTCGGGLWRPTYPFCPP